MRLFEHPDFEQALIQGAAHHDLNEQFVEKDYYVTEILRIVAETLGEHAIFKGGTSLSKGWGLITRFSEDIDLVVNLDSFRERPGRNKTDTILRKLAEAVADHPALNWLRDEGGRSRGLNRRDWFAYDTRFDALPGIRAAVLLEPGVRSGSFPTEVRPLSSLVADFLLESESGDFADVEDLAGFEMTLLHFRRTFIEKMFALHGKVISFQEGGPSLDRDARHYADLYVLLGEIEVRDMLTSDEYREIREDLDKISRAFFSSSYRQPEDLSFSNSPAFFPDPELRATLASAHDEQCMLLFPDANYPSFDEVLARFEEMRSLL